MKKLNGKQIAILMTDGVEDSEFRVPYNTLNENGATVHIISPRSGSIKTWKDHNWHDEVDADKILTDTDPSVYDALVLPGGVMNPDTLRTNKNAVNFARHFLEEGKPVAAICHGPWLLIETELISDRMMTSWPSLKTDLSNAGAKWVDSEVVVDNGLVTSRKPDDLPAFCEKMIEEITEGMHAH
jgi:protease I